MLRRWAETDEALVRTAVVQLKWRQWPLGEAWAYPWEMNAHLRPGGWWHKIISWQWVDLEWLIKNLPLIIGCVRRVHCVLYAHNQAALAVINSFGQIHSSHEGTTVSVTMALFWQLNGINIICSTFSKFTLSFLFSVALLFRDSLITCSVAAWRFLPLWVSGSMNMTVKRRINFLFHCPSLCLKSQLAFLPPAFFLPTASLLHLTWKYMRL